MEIDFTKVSDSDRRCLVFLKEYETVRRESGQWGYRPFSTFKEEDFQKPLFKQIQTVTAWIISNGMDVTWNEINWRGYIQFCFTQLSPHVPMPGQLKNIMLLTTYRRDHSISEAPEGKSQEEMLELYRRILSPRLPDVAIQQMLGL